MQADIINFTQSLDGFQIESREILESTVDEASRTSKLSQLFVINGKKSTVNLYIKRNTYSCPHCGSKRVSCYKNSSRTIRGLPIGNYPTVLHIMAHRIYCKDCQKQSYEHFPFLSQPKSRVTTELERTIIALRSELSISAISEYYDLDWTLVKNIEKNHLKIEYKDVCLKGVRALGIDEIHTFARADKSEKYITVVRNLETGDVLEVADGKGVGALKDFSNRIKPFCKQIAYVCMDMSNAYSSWVRNQLPNADIVFDRFHLIKSMNEKLDQIRRRTIKKADKERSKILKGERYTLLRNPENLSTKGIDTLEQIRETFSELSDAYAFKEELRGIYRTAQNEYDARLLLHSWCIKASLSAIPELQCMTNTIINHLEGILGFWKHNGATNAASEGFNNKIRWLIRQAYGYRDREYFKLKVYSLPSLRTTRSL